MAYQRGSLKKVMKKEGLTWVLRYRMKRSEQTPLIVGVVADFLTKDEASLEADRLGLRVRINCANLGTRRVRFNELAEYYLKVEFDPEVTATPKSANTLPILEHYVRDILIAKWGEQIAEDIEPLEIQKWCNAMHNKDEYAWTTVSKIRGIMNRIFKVGRIHKKVVRNPVEGLQTSTTTTYKAIKITPAQTLLILRSMMQNILHFTLVFVVAATALRSSEVLSLRWADILWEERKIRIIKSWKKIGVDGETKTPCSERDVPMGRVLTHYLREWHKQTLYAIPTDFVFPSLQKRGRVPICASVFCRVHLRPAAMKAGVVIPDGHRWGLHNLRHSLSNWLVNKAKENPKTVQGILGHSRIQTTLDLYTDEDLDEMIAAQEKFLDAVGFGTGSVQ
ncbi:MAG: site-specific integrase [Candidatus Acidiferrales bacterium]